MKRMRDGYLEECFFGVQWEVDACRDGRAALERAGFSAHLVEPVQTADLVAALSRVER